MTKDEILVILPRTKETKKQSNPKEPQETPMKDNQHCQVEDIDKPLSATCHSLSLSLSYINWQWQHIHQMRDHQIKYKRKNPRYSRH
jgi:hypothetical protein